MAFLQCFYDAAGSFAGPCLEEAWGVGMTYQIGIFDNKNEPDWEKFKRIHKEKPEIYQEFCRVTKTLMERGWAKYSAYGIMHVVRFRVWKPGVTMRPEEQFKISNNMIPFYARLYCRDNPETNGFFCLREKKLQGFQEEWINEI